MISSGLLIDQSLGAKVMDRVILKRFAYLPSGTLGMIKCGEQKFWTVERPWLDNMAFKSCIPEGEYVMTRRVSPKFGETWHIKDVPERSHILIHAGNYPNDFHGCVGLGTKLLDDRVAVANSRVAVNKFEDLLGKDDHTIEIGFEALAAL